MQKTMIFSKPVFLSEILPYPNVHLVSCATPGGLFHGEVLLLSCAWITSASDTKAVQRAGVKVNKT